jgi:UDP-glucose 4-epimerase
MKILVTGGAGFIGSHLVEALLAEGHQVQVLDNLYSGVRENVPAGVPFYEMDIQDPQVMDIFAAEKFDVVYHQAAQMDVRLSVSDPLFDARVNILGSINLIEAGHRNGLKKFIFASSGGAGYGEQDYFPADEAHPIRPISPYGITKVTVERYLYYYHAVQGLPYISLRYANVYGPRQSPHGEAGVVAIFSKRMLAGIQPIINGDGLQTRDFVFVGDVVRANVLALKHEKSGCYNVGTGIETDIVTLFQEMNKHMGGAFKQEHQPGKPGEQLRSVLSHELISTEMGWKPQVDFYTGLGKTMEWFKGAIKH